MGGLRGMFGGGNMGGMGGIIPMLASGQSMGLIPMLMGQGGGMFGQGQQQDQPTQQPATFLQPQQGGGFMPNLAGFLQGRYGR